MLTNRRHTAPSWRKYLIAGWAFVECLLFSGILYGWSSLVFVLKEEGIYADLCDNDDVKDVELTFGIAWNTTLNTTDDTTTIQPVTLLANNTGTNYSVLPNKIRTPCKPQDSMLSLCFTIGSSIFCASCVVMGHINYKLGTRITRIIAFVFFIGGSLCLALVSKENPWLIFPGLSCIGIGGLPILVTNTQVSNLFVKDRSTVVGLLVGGYDMSSVIFLMVKLTHQNGISRRYMYFVLTGVHAMTLVSTFIFLPRGFITYTDTKIDIELKTQEDQQLSTDLLKSRRHKARRPSLADRQPLSGYIKQPMFISHLLWVCLLQLRFYYFLGNLNTYLNRLLDEDNALVSHFTDVCFYTMMCGLVTSFLAGIVYDKLKAPFARGRTKLYRALMPAVLPLMFASILAIAMSVLVLLPYRALLYPMFIILVLFRSFLYALVTAFISAIFPSEFFAMLYGITIVSAGVFSCLQYAFFQWAESYNNAPFHADVCLLCISLLSLIHPTYMWIACKREEKSVE